MSTVYEFEGRFYKNLDAAIGHLRVGDVVLDLVTNEPDRVIGFDGNAVLLDKSLAHNGSRYEYEVRLLKEV